MNKPRVILWILGMCASVGLVKFDLYFHPDADPFYTGVWGIFCGELVGRLFGHD